MSKQRVCKWCKNKGNLEKMVVYEKETGKFNKNGTPRVTRSCYHKACNDEYLKDQEFKQQEAVELDELYEHILHLHQIEVVDGRMFKRIQDLRNGTVSSARSTIRKYKQGVPYSLMLESYRYSAKNIEHAMRTMTFQTTWNEFAYVFAIMERNINEVKKIKKHNEKQVLPDANKSEDHKLKVMKPRINKKNDKKPSDDLDISQFL